MTGMEFLRAKRGQITGGEERRGEKVSLEVTRRGGLPEESSLRTHLGSPGSGRTTAIEELGYSWKKYLVVL